MSYFRQYEVYWTSGVNKGALPRHNNSVFVSLFWGGRSLVFMPPPPPNRLVCFDSSVVPCGYIYFIYLFSRCFVRLVSGCIFLLLSYNTSHHTRYDSSQGYASSSRTAVCTMMVILYFEVLLFYSVGVCVGSGRACMVVECSTRLFLFGKGAWCWLPF